MSRIDELIAELCSDGVEHKPLAEVGEFIRGNGLQKIDLKTTGVGAIHYGQIHTHYGTWATETKSFVSEPLAAKLRKARPGDLVIATTSEDDEAVAKAVAWVGNTEIAVSGDAYIYRHTLEPKYVAYFFQSEQFQDQKKRHITGTKVRRVSGDSLAKIRIPVPPPEVQHEIVKVLDKFTKLEAELEAELEARRRQYKYYRDALLTFGERTDADANKQATIRWMTLSEAALEFGRGKSKHRPRNDPRLYGGDIPFIQTGDIRNAPHVITSYTQTYSELGLTQSKLWPKGTLCITIAANIAETTILGFDACFPDSVIGFVANSEKVNVHYVEYLLTSLKSKLQAQGQGSAQDNINLATFENERFPFPPLEEQERIVSILDKFDALVNDLSSGLPAEIRARRQQYEHYRDRLLTFREAA
ncbi:MAG: restriction endonuclease subunit S [Burkholderiaceae bacterium]|nr:restriction endonuclease subunit S [Burkholderiaceae bacterium]MEB2319489.1 restriction endonuclease subunit S [Pseudomonadota bacterium]